MSNELIQALVDALDELGEGLKCAEPGAARAMRHASAAVTRAKILADPRWDEPTEDGWYWCEKLDDGAPPQQLRSYRPILTNSNGTKEVDWDSPRRWQRWTISGWVDLVGRVAPCVGRPRKAGE